MEGSGARQSLLETAFSGLRRYPLCGHKAVAIAASAAAAAHLLAFKTLLVCFPLRLIFFFRSPTFLFQINWVVREAICAGSSRLEVPASSRLLLRFFYTFFILCLCCFLFPYLFFALPSVELFAHFRFC